MSSLTLTRGTYATLDRITSAKVYRIRPATSVRLSSYWDGGSIDRYCGFDAHGSPVALPAHEGAPQFGGNSADVQLDGNPVAYIRQDSVFCGKHMSPAIYLPPAEFEAIKAQEESKRPALSAQQLFCLQVTGSLKSAGRLDEWTRKCDAADWQPTRDSLVPLGLMRKNGAITPDGRNACADAPQLWSNEWDKLLAGN